MKASEYMKRLNLLLEEEDLTSVDPVTGLPWDLPDTGSGSNPREPDIEIDPGRKGKKGGGNKPPSEDDIDWRNPCVHGSPTGYENIDGIGRYVEYANYPDTNMMMAVRKFLPWCHHNAGHPDLPGHTLLSVTQVADLNSDILTELELTGLERAWTMINHVDEFGMMINRIHFLSRHGSHGLCMSKSLVALVGRALKKIADCPDWQRRIGARSKSIPY
jgi:hypothetical protein